MKIKKEISRKNLLKIFFVVTLVLIFIINLFIMTEKVYTPEVVEENPFPGETSEALGGASDAPAGKVYSPSVAPTNTVRTQRAATQLLSRALNTRSKKILQEFQLQESGGFKIGDFKKGTSGDLRLTPNGMTTRDKAGSTTFAIDGLTGDAIFKGEIRAGSVMVEGEVVDENGVTIIDSLGLVSGANFASDNIKASPAQSFTSGTYADVTGATLTINLPRESKVLILAGCDLYFSFVGGDGIGTGSVGLKIGDDSPVKSMIKRGEEKDTYAIGSHLSTHFLHTIETLPAGETIIKLQARETDTAGTPTFVVYTADLSYVVLGK